MQVVALWLKTPLVKDVTLSSNSVIPRKGSYKSQIHNFSYCTLVARIIGPHVYVEVFFSSKFNCTSQTYLTLLGHVFKYAFIHSCTCYLYLSSLSFLQLCVSCGTHITEDASMGVYPWEQDIMALSWRWWARPAGKCKRADSMGVMDLVLLGLWMWPTFTFDST